MVDIGKGIARWNATDIGVFRCSPEFLVEADALVAAGVDVLAYTVTALYASGLLLTACLLSFSSSASPTASTASSPASGSK